MTWTRKCMNWTTKRSDVDLKGIIHSFFLFLRHQNLLSCYLLVRQTSGLEYCIEGSLSSSLVLILLRFEVSQVVPLASGLVCLLIFWTRVWCRESFLVTVFCCCDLRKLCTWWWSWCVASDRICCEKLVYSNLCRKMLPSVHFWEEREVTVSLEDERGRWLKRQAKEGISRVWLYISLYLSWFFSYLKNILQTRHSVDILFWTLPSGFKVSLFISYYSLFILKST